MSISEDLSTSKEMVLTTGCIMRAPPLFTTVRVNRFRISMEEAQERLTNLVANSRFGVEIHPVIPDLLVVKGHGPHLDPETNPPEDLEIYVDPPCGESVARGAPIYAPGVMGSSGHFDSGQQVSAWLDVKQKVLKGHKSGKLVGPKIWLGNGVCRRGRQSLFSTLMPLTEVPDSGVGVEVTEPVWDHPAGISGNLGDWGYPQNLPSTLVAHLLDPRPGETVLDMCASPGGKATHIAALMQDQGRLVCLDRNPRRTIHIQRNAAAQDLKCLEIKSFYDSILALDPTLPLDSAPNDPPYPPNYFDRILVDAPCSSLGQRPILRPLKSQKSIRSAEKTQYSLLKTAVGLVKPGGTVVYSTCTIRSAENEAHVARILREFPEMVLSPAKIILGNDQVIIDGVDRSLDGSCQKFSPQKFCAKHPKGNCVDFLTHKNDMLNEAPCSVFSNNYTSTSLNFDTDTISFFMAKLKKCG